MIDSNTIITAVSTLTGTLLGGVITLFIANSMYRKKMETDRISSAREACKELSAEVGCLLHMGATLVSTGFEAVDIFAKYKHWNPYLAQLNKVQTCINCCQLELRDSEWSDTLEKMYEITSWMGDRVLQTLERDSQVSQNDNTNEVKREHVELLKDGTQQLIKRLHAIEQ